MRSPTLIQIDEADPAATRAELLAGLIAPQAVVAPKYFYDALGSRLFAAITELPEYYPTRTEAAIFAAHASAIARQLPENTCLVDLGAGNCEKAARLFAPFGVERYVAVDISVDYLRQSLDLLQRRHPAMDLAGIGLDFSTRLELPDAVGDGPRLMFYPGSSIGNFTPAEAEVFLRQVHAASRGGGLLIGVDLVKPRAVLELAYDDPLQVTAAFNRNLLRHLNRLTGTDFAIDDWKHVAYFNGAESRIEMHLEALRELTVTWPEHGNRNEPENAHGHRFEDGPAGWPGDRRKEGRASGAVAGPASGPAQRRDFARGERIHTENSYKWSVDNFAALLADAGFKRLRHWTDERRWFAVFLASA